MCRIWLLLLLLLLVCPTLAQSGSVTVRLSRKRITVDEPLTMVVTLRGPGIERMQLPALVPPGFEELSRSDSPMLSQDAFGTVVSGRTIRIQLQPLGGGKFRLGAFSLTYNGITYRSAGEIVEVEGPAFRPPRSSSVQPRSSVPRPEKPVPPAQPTQDLQAFNGPVDVRLSAEVDKKRVYVGERIVYSIRITHNSTEVREIKLVDLPQFANFWNQEIELDRHVSPARQFVIGGRYYVTQLIPRFRLYPATSGRLVIPALTYRMMPGQSASPVTLRTEPVSIEVLPLPEQGRPVGFKGAVGSYSMQVSLMDTVGRVGVPVRLAIELETDGNIDALTPPTIPPLNGAKVYELSRLKPVSDPRYNAGSNLVRWEANVVPTVAGELRIPELEFAYFDPVQRVYKTLRSRPLSIEIADAERPTADEVVVQSQNGWAVTFLKSRWFNYSLVGLLILGCLVAVGIVGRQQWIRYTVLRAEVERAKLELLQTREELRRLVNGSYGKLHRGDEKGYASDLLTVMLRVSQRLSGTARGDLEDFCRLLRHHRCDEALIRSVKELYEECERVKFAPSSTSLNRDANYARFNRARDILNRLIALIG